MRAISLGTAVPSRDFDAVVHSIFVEAANLRPIHGRHLLTLVTADSADLPQGIRLETPQGFSFEERLEPGDRVTCRDGILQDERERLAIDMRTAMRWKCQLPDSYCDLISFTAAWESVLKTLSERQGQTGAEIRAAELFDANLPGQSAVTRKMGPLVRGLAEAARKPELPDDVNIAGLIGLGPGLTPAGDDFLVGFLTGLRCTTDKEEARLAFLSDLGKTVVRLSRRTNDISRTSLFHATRGQVSSRLAFLAEAIARGEDFACLRQVAEAAMRMGHSSGMDTVTGLLLGLSTWTNAGTDLNGTLTNPRFFPQGFPNESSVDFV